MRCKSCGRECAMLVRPGVTDYRCTWCSGSLSAVTAPKGAPTPVERAIQAAQVQRAGDIVRHYRLDEYLGRGAYGEVWKAEDISLKRPVALKVLVHVPADEVERFYHEARTAAALDHENIAPIHEVFEAEGRHFIAMKYLEGKTLDEAGLSVPAMLEAMYLVARAIDYAHRRGIVHRDLKPKNIMIEHPPGRQDYRVFVCDFGLARGMEEHEGEEGRVIGTPSFMSPEQAAGGVATPASDVYGLGTTLYAVLTGEPPFTGPTVDDVLEMVLAVDAPKLRARRPDLHPALESLLDSALQKDPKRRPPSAIDFGEELRSLLDTGRVYYAAPSAIPPEVRDVVAELRRGFGKYIVVSTLGRNAAGPLLKAWDTSLQRFVAVRVLDDPHDAPARDAVDRAMREARACATLRHPAIPQIFEIGVFKGRHYLSRAFVDGQNLMAAALDPARLAKAGHDVAEAVHYAHGEGVIHGNITPENIVIGDDGRVSLVDFGLGGSGSVLTEALSYRPPEGEAGPQADVYGLGASLCEALSRVSRRDLQRLLAGGGAPPLPAGTPPELARILEKAVAASTTIRYGSAFELALALERIVAASATATVTKRDTSIDAAPGAGGGKTRPPTKRSKTPTKPARPPSKRRRE